MLDRASDLNYLYSIGEMDQAYLEKSYKKMQKSAFYMESVIIPSS